jgi:hypothetical protein
MGKRELLACQTLGDNHSADTTRVYCGEAQPLNLCGYHYKYHLQAVITATRKATN